ncbi:MAG: alpha/beta hydrolase [Alphaproteobacteria bacterium]|nr:MAG: alpha/beta hydrolase [Alphaproteobacteria bacterium]
MSELTVPIRGAEMAVTRLDGPPDSTHCLVWAHGWGQSGQVFLGLAQSFSRMHPSGVIDFPGFGRAKPPPETWDTAAYADAVADWLRSLSPRSLIWIGHSFGCRVGLQIAARHPGLLRGMVLIAAAGLPRQRSLLETIRLKARSRVYKLASRLAPNEAARERLRARFGSADYRNAGPMRGILVKVIQEDLTQVASTVTCPTLLVYGKQDTETPPEIGERLARLIKNAELVVLDGYDHYDILSRGQHQVATQIRKFLDGRV